MERTCEEGDSVTASRSFAYTMLDDGDEHRANASGSPIFRSDMSGLLSRLPCDASRSQTSRCSSDVDGVPLLYRCRLLYKCDDDPGAEGLSEQDLGVKYLVYIIINLILIRSTTLQDDTAFYKVTNTIITRL